MRRFKSKKKINMTITKFFVVVFFSILLFTCLLINDYGNKYSKLIINLANHKIEKITYQFFSDLITDQVITNDLTQDIININMNSKEEIISVDYNLEKTYELLTDVSEILKVALADFENGKIDTDIYDSYLKSNKYGTYLSVPFFAGNNNIFLTNLGPKIPIHIHFTGSLLTNVKTKLTDYGLNNALLELYIVVNINETLVTPITNQDLNLDYDILIAAKVINGSVPMFYGNTLEKNSDLVNTPIEN